MAENPCLPAVQLGHDQLPLLLSKMAAMLPRCVHVYEMVESIVSRGWRSHLVWVDRWPDVKAIVAVPDRTHTKDPYSVQFHVAYSEEEAVLLNLLDQVGNWNHDMVLLMPEFTGGIDKLFETKDMSVTEVGRVHLFHMPTLDDAPTLTLPDEVTIGDLTPDLIPMAVSEWRPDGSAHEEMMASLQANYSFTPSVCLFVNTGQPMAYELVYFFGAMGMLYTKPAHRRRGLAKLVITLLARKLIAQQRHVFAYIENYNQASVTLHEQLGFKDGGAFSFYVYKSNVSDKETST